MHLPTFPPPPIIGILGEMFRIFGFTPFISASYRYWCEHKRPLSALQHSAQGPCGFRHSPSLPTSHWLKLIRILPSLLLLLVPLALLGCTTSALVDLPVREGVYCKHQKHCANRMKVRLHVEIEPTIPNRLGTQFLFLIIPFGGTDQGQLHELTFNTAFEELTFAGYEVLLGPSHEDSVALAVQIEVRELSITTYDLLFTRRVRVHGVIHLRTKNSASTPVLKIPLQHTFSSRSPGSERISRGYRQALRSALRTALKKDFGHLYQRAVE